MAFWDKGMGLQTYFSIPDIRKDRRKLAVFLRFILIGMLLLSILLSLGWGPASDTNVIGALQSKFINTAVSLRDQVIVWDIRMPRVLIGTLVGATLAVSGAIMQGLFRNPLADPGLIGVSSGASLGAVVAIILASFLPLALRDFLGSYLVPTFAFIMSWITTLALYAIATRNGRTSVATMLLAGIAFGALSGALTGMIVYMADDQQLRDFTFWSMGSLAGATWEKLWTAGPLMLLTLLISPFLAKSLNAFALGEAVAGHLGIKVQFMKRAAILTVAASVGSAVAITGGIGFIGIVVPHILRLIQGPDHKGLLINSGLLGAIFLLFADAISRTVIAPAEIPIGIVTAIIGGPFFMWVLLKNRSAVDL